MKSILLLGFMVFLIPFLVVAQIDTHGNPVFNSIYLSEDTLEDCIVTGSYYTMKNNVDNKNSSVYISETPTLEELIDFARTKPSYFFMISKNKVVSHMIMVLSKIDGKKSVYSYLILNPNTNEQVEVHSDTKGDVTELRAYELKNNGYDKDATELKFGSKKLCVFNKIAYSIQPIQMVKKEVITLVKKYNLSKTDVDLKKMND